MSLENSILFISHDATRTGAPILLKHHLQGLKKQYPEVGFDILLKDGGELSAEFEQIAKVLVIPGRSLKTRVLNFIRKGYNDYDDRAKAIIGKKYKLVYANTVVTSDLLRLAKMGNTGTTTVCHVHELDIAIKQFFGPALFRKAIPYIDHFVAASQAVADILIQNYNIPADKINLHYEHIPVLKTIPQTNGLLKEKGLRICGCGTLDWRKGADLFILAAAQLQKTQPELDFHFYWVGGKKNSVEYEKLMYDIDRLEIGHRVTIIESCPNPLDYIGECDVYLLSSREDPFPLVCLEAASLGKPIICFKRSGGMPEFVDDKIGWLINYLDLGQLNTLLNELLQMPERNDLLVLKGKAARERVKNYDIELGVKKLKQYLNVIMNA